LKYMMLVIVACMLVLSCSGQAVAVIVNPTADAATNSVRLTQNFGTSTELWIGVFWEGGQHSRSYLKFDLSGIPGVTSATLWLYNGVNAENTGQWTEGASTWNPADVSSHSTDSSWTEGGITWDNQPDLGTAGGSTTVNNALGWYSWDVTSLAQASSGENLSLALASSGAGHIYYANDSDFADFRPYLDVSPIPEPATMMLIGSLATGLFGIAAVRKKRR